MQKSQAWACAFCVCLLVAVVSVHSQSGKNDKSGSQSNEAHAVGCLRSLNTAQAYYARTYPEIGFTCNLQDFNLPAPGQAASAKAANLIDQSLTSGEKNGYKFKLTCQKASKPQRTYNITAVPKALGKTGGRAFCSDESGVIRYAADGKAATCLSAGKPLQ